MIFFFLFKIELNLLLIIIPKSHYKMSTIDQKNIEMLTNAVKNDDLTMIEDLLIKGTDPYASIHEFFGSPFFIAIRLSKLEIIEKFIIHGIDINKPNKNDHTPLYSACINNLPNVVELLIKHDVDINNPNINNGDTPLHAAIWYDLPNNIIELIINKGADINKPNNAGYTPLMVAIVMGNNYIIQLLIKMGTDINKPSKNGNTPLIIAVNQNHPYIVKRILEKGANPHTKTKAGETALEYAIKKKYIEIINIIKSYIKTQFLYTCIGLRKQQFGDNVLFEIGKHFLESEKEIITIINQSNKHIEK